MLQEFKDTAANGGAALRCLNEMVTDALRHAPDSLTYLASIHDPHVFRFCAIPQVRPPTVELTCPVWHLDNRSMARVTVWADHGGGHIGGVLQQHQPFSRCRQNEKRSNRDCALTPAPATTAGRGLGCCAEAGWSGLSAGLSAVHMVGTRSMQDVYTAFHHFAALLADKVGPRIRCKDPSLSALPSVSSTVAPGG